MNAYIVDGVRTPIGNLKGQLSTVRPDDMAAHVIRELVKRHPKLDLSAIGDVILGCANQAGEDNRNVARMALLLAGLPQTVPGTLSRRFPCSLHQRVQQPFPEERYFDHQPGGVRRGTGPPRAVIAEPATGP